MTKYSMTYTEAKGIIEVHGIEVLRAYVYHVGADCATADDFEDTYCGQYNSEEDYAEQLVDELGLLESMPKNLRSYFDYEKYARDIFIDGYYRDDDSGAVFRRQ